MRRAQEDVEKNDAAAGPDGASGGRGGEGVDGGLAISMTSRPGIDEWIEGTSEPTTGAEAPGAFSITLAERWPSAWRLLRKEEAERLEASSRIVHRCRDVNAARIESVSALVLPPLPFEPALLGAGTVAQLGYVEEREASNQSSSHSSDCDPSF